RALHSFPTRRSSALPLRPVEETLMATRRFHLHPAGLLITLAALALCLNLGFWQLDRAEEKTALLASMESRGQLAPVPLEELLAMADPAHFPVQQIGRASCRARA